MLDGWHISRRGAAPALLVTLLLSGSASAPAADLYWSGSGNWDTTSTIWGTVTGGPYDAATWNNSTPDAATFQGTAGTITLAEAITAAGLTFETTGYTLSGNTLTLSGTPTIATGTGSATIASVLAGTSGFAKTGSGTLTLSAANSISGAATVSAGRIVLGADAALGTMAVTLDGGSIERNAAGATVANAIAVGAAGGTVVGRTTVDNYMTLSGQLTGSGSLTVQGLVNLSNTSNTYAGTLTISNASASFLRVSASEVLGDATVLTFGGAGAELRLDGGVTETIAGLNGAAGNIFVADGGGGPARLRVSSGSYGGTLTNGNRSLILEKVGSGTLTLSRSAGNAAAIGNVEVSGGTLQLAATGLGFSGGYFTGSQPFTVRSGATLEIAQVWNTSPNNVYTIDGGTLRLSANTAADSTNYVNNLTLQNGGTLAGNGVRVGYFANTTYTISGTSASTISANLLLTANSGFTTTLNVADVTGSAAADLLVSGVIGDNPGFAGMPLVKSGAGTVSLTAANTYTGPTTIAAGGVTIANSSALGGGSLTLASAATGSSTVSLLLESQMVFSKAITVAANGTGTVTLGSTDSATGTNREFSGVVTLARDLTLQAGSTDRTTFTNQITGTGNVTITSPFASGRRVVFDRPSGSANNFVGDLTLGAGAWLQLGVANSIGNRTLPDTATISFTDANSQLRPATTGSGDSETVGTLVSLAAGAGRVDMFTGSAFTLKVGGDDESGTFSGTIVNSSGALTIEKIGSGTQTLSGANTYGGSTIVTSGTLVVGNGAGDGSIGSGAVTVASGATFTINRGGFGQVWGNNFSGTGTLRILAGQDPQFSGDNRGFTGPVTIDGAGAQFRTRSANAWSGQSVVTITNGGMASVFSYVGSDDIKIGSLWGNGTVRIGAGGSDRDLYLGGNNLDATFTGTIVNDAGGSGSVIKNGTGNQVLSGASSYTGGTTINAGRLTVGHANALGTTGAITIASGGTLGIADGITFTRPLTINAGGKVRTGNNSTVSLPSVSALAAWESQSATGDQTLASILNSSGVTVPSALATAWTANPDPASTFSDILTLDGTGAGNTYVLSMGYSGNFGAMNIWYRTNVGDPFTPLGTNFAGNVPWDSSFTTVGQYGVDTSAGTVWVVTNHNSQFVVVPEPGSRALAAAGLAAGIWYLRGRRAARRR